MPGLGTGFRYNEVGDIVRLDPNDPQSLVKELRRRGLAGVIVWPTETFVIGGLGPLYLIEEDAFNHRCPIFLGNNPGVDIDTSLVPPYKEKAKPREKAEDLELRVYNIAKYTMDDPAKTAAAPNPMTTSTTPQHSSGLQSTSTPVLSAGHGSTPSLSNSRSSGFYKPILQDDAANYREPPA
ncbi:hypothetical protein TWF703_004965 [Orbilia oligospora]|uniref:Uncharacterized protein n=1 Tax=Orbilia oligospora TaxID=2813651 RepID=A0A7C8JX50_ORBOL|nr:hypothetical protein TWF703_004965 [Orbilia oligospora]